MKSTLAHLNFRKHQLYWKMSHQAINWAWPLLHKWQSVLDTEQTNENFACIIFKKLHQHAGKLWGTLTFKGVWCFFRFFLSAQIPHQLGFRHWKLLVTSMFCLLSSWPTCKITTNLEQNTLRHVGAQILTILQLSHNNQIYEKKTNSNLKLKLLFNQ